MKRILTKLGAQFLVFGFGILLIMAGTWLISPAASLIAGGSLLLLDVFVGRLMECYMARKAGEE